MKIEAWLSVGIVGATRKHIIEIPDEDLEDCESEQEIEEYINEYVQEWANNYLDIGWRTVE